MSQEKAAQSSRRSELLRASRVNGSALAAVWGDAMNRTSRHEAGPRLLTALIALAVAAACAYLLILLLSPAAPTGSSERIDGISFPDHSARSPYSLGLRVMRTAAAPVGLRQCA
jgi:hypothetical protein